MKEGFYTYIRFPVAEEHLGMTEAVGLLEKVREVEETLSARAITEAMYVVSNYSWLPLTPVRKTVDGETYDYVAFDITRFASRGSTDLIDKIREELDSIESLELTGLAVSSLARVTATDVRYDFKILREGKYPHGLDSLPYFRLVGLDEEHSLVGRIS